MKAHILISLKMLLVMTVLCGVLYPLAMTGLSMAIFPHKSGGSLIEQNGNIIGSELIGQKFHSDRYFWSRPSAGDYGTLPSAASNYGPTSDTLKKLVEFRRAEFIKTNGLAPDVVIPKEMIFASGSGLDPHVSPEAARLQIDRIARVREFNANQKIKLRALVANSVEPPQWGFLGEPRVNVLKLNLALDGLK